MAQMAGSWLIASVLRERIQQMSSALFARLGRSSVFIHMPHLPAGLNLYLDGAMGKRAWPLVIVVSRWPLRMLGGRSLSNIACMPGLWSNRSIWAGPPTMWR